MRADLLPIIFAIVILLAVFLSYSIAVSLHHVPAYLPYISDTGVRVPERSVFSQFVNLAAFFHMVTIYVRYEQVRAEIKYRWRNEEHFRGGRKLQSWNRWSLGLGMCISFGLSLIGNFQLHSHRTSEQSNHLTNEENVVQKIHWFGAFLTFILGNLWMVMHSIISIFLSIGTKKGLWRRRTAFVRLVITILSTIMVVAGIASAVVAATHADEATGTLEWNDSASNISDEGFKGRLSLTAVLCEWICTFLIVLFSVSLVPEFRVIEIYRPVVVTKAYQKSLKAATPSTGAEVPDELEDVSDNRNNAHHQPNDTSSEPLMQLP